MSKNVYGSGLRNVGSYQVAGGPYVSSSTITVGAEEQFEFPQVANNITIKANSFNDALKAVRVSGSIGLISDVAPFSTDGHPYTISTWCSMSLETISHSTFGNLNNIQLIGFENTGGGVHYKATNRLQFHGFWTGAGGDVAGTCKPNGVIPQGWFLVVARIRQSPSDVLVGEASLTFMYDHTFGDNPSAAATHGLQGGTSTAGYKFVRQTRTVTDGVNALTPKNFTGQKFCIGIHVERSTCNDVHHIDPIMWNGYLTDDQIDLLYGGGIYYDPNKIEVEKRAWLDLRNEDTRIITTAEDLTDSGTTAGKYVPRFLAGTTPELIQIKQENQIAGSQTATGSVTVAYPSASAVFTTAGTPASDHHGDSITFDGTEFTVNYEGTGSFGVNEIKTYDMTGSALYFSNPADSQDIYLKTDNYGTARSFVANDGNAWSVSFWLNKQASGDDFGTIFKFGSTEDIGGSSNIEFTSLASIQGTDLYIYQPNKASAGASNVTWTGAVIEEQFHHFVITCDGVSNRATYILYRDGVSLGSRQMGADVTDMCLFNEHLYIGDSEVDPAVAIRELKGYMQTFGIWDKQLDAQEANELYNTGSVKLAAASTMVANLKDWWRFDSGSDGHHIAGTTESTDYYSNNVTILTAGTNFASNVSVVQGVPIERHAQTGLYTAVTDAFNTTTNFGTFDVATPTANSSIINITASLDNANNKISLVNNRTFTNSVQTSNDGEASLRIHFRTTGSTNVATNHHYWSLGANGEQVEMNIKTKEIYLSTDKGECEFALHADLTNIPTSSMYQHTGLGVDD